MSLLFSYCVSHNHPSIWGVARDHAARTAMDKELTMGDRARLPWRDTRARVGGSHGKLVPDGRSNIDIDWDSVQERSSGHLSTDDVDANALLHATRQLLADPELDNRQRRVLSEIERQSMDTLLADRRSWCPTCINVLHNCICVVPPHLLRNMVSEVGVQLIHRLRQADVDEREARSKAEKLARRTAYRQAKRARSKGQ